MDAHAEVLAVLDTRLDIVLQLEEVVFVGIVVGNMVGREGVKMIPHQVLFEVEVLLDTLAYGICRRRYGAPAVSGHDRRIQILDMGEQLLMLLIHLGKAGSILVAAGYLSDGLFGADIFAGLERSEERRV